jgi:hypothetical protein
MFSYLGRIVLSTDSDWPALQKNLTKTQQRWGMISRVLCHKGTNARISVKFYKVVVLTILLHGSESWVWTCRMHKASENFHNNVARHLLWRTAWFHNGQWTCPPVADALRACGMHPIAVYIHNRLDISGQAIYAACLNSTRLAETHT